MKRISKIVLLVAILANTLIPAWAQSSTQGKEFWVALTMAIRPPNDGDGEAKPYLAISTKEKTKVTIYNYDGSKKMESTLEPNSWKTVTPDLDWWYPSGVGNPDKVKAHADEVNKYGVYVKADKDISVFAVVRAVAGMDASNVLPVTALGKEYILQDYIPIAKNNDKDKPYISMATILATEDNTEITVKPKGTLLSASSPKLVNNKITLNRGQTYYLMAENSGSDNNCLSGTEVTSDKDIAVFQGVPCTFIPHSDEDKIGNRDALFEQAMPVDYWGTEFVATRSFAKGANFIRITASEENKETTITLNGKVASKKIKRGETYEIELASNVQEKMKYSDKKKPNMQDTILVGEYVHIKTSCPSAVYSYDCGRAYVDADATETNPDGNQQGDPSSVWIAPLEQSIDQITFGVCGTGGDNKTEYHFIDLVVETASANQTIIYPAPADMNYQFKPVVGTIYSYARIYLAKADNTQEKSFTIGNTNGFVAHVYGNGESESYAYSVGSSTVKQGIKIGGSKFDTDTIIQRPMCCVGEPVELDAQVGTDVIKRVIWKFGDNTSEDNDYPKTTHTYTSEGWYDIEAELYGHQVCEETPEEDGVFLGKVTVHVRVVHPVDSVVRRDRYCITVSEYKNANAEQKAKFDYLLQHGDTNIINNPQHCYDTTYLEIITYGLETETYKIDPNDVPSNAELLPSSDPNKPDTVRFSLSEDDEVAEFYGKTYLSSQDIVDTVVQRELPHCNHYRHAFVDVQTCLGVKIVQDEARDTLQVCPGDSMRAFCVKVRGNIETDAEGKSNAHFIVDGWVDANDIQIVDKDGSDSIEIIFPTDSITRPGLYKAQLILATEYKNPEKCKDSIVYNFAFTVNYSDTIFQYKFNNVLAIYSWAFNGHFNFTNYEWHRIRKDEVTGEDVNKIVGGNSPVYRDTVPFHLNDIYYVRLTTTDSLGNDTILDSCPKEILNVPGVPQPAEEEAPAQKVIYHDRLVIRKGELMYDIYGQRIQ